MIGVVSNPGEEGLVREFFELFKTPWEFYRPNEQYDVVLLAREDATAQGVTAGLIVVYAGKETRFDREKKIKVASCRSGGMASYKGSRFPIYGDVVTFLDEDQDFLREEQFRQPAGVREHSCGTNLARVGYDLFRELRTLLAGSQPPEHADIPTVELHITLLRDLIVESNLPLVEIPPIPERYAFIACLTHDVDHPSIRLHRWDHTAFGFLYRAVIGSIRGVLNGRASLQHLLVNWIAAAKLPFIYLGLARDFWLEFDRYLAIERDADSTFFVLPFKGRPGKTVSGVAPRIRTSAYAAEDIAERIQTFVAARREIGLHGIDAWIDSAKGQEEKAHIENVAGTKIGGVRMHWLYFNEGSPATLEQAGFTYDSTVGYNETVGYRAGTTQVYKPIMASRILELPLHVMDTALFYPDYLNLSAAEAEKRVGSIIDTVCQFGGVLTINWHDRSIAPERLWGQFYVLLIDKLKERGGWCTSAEKTVAWFQARRSVSFRRSGQGVEVTVPDILRDSDPSIPGLRVRVHHSTATPELGPKAHSDASLVSTMTVPLLGGR